MVTTREIRLLKLTVKSMETWESEDLSEEKFNEKYRVEMKNTNDIKCQCDIWKAQRLIISRYISASNINVSKY